MSSGGEVCPTCGSDAHGCTVLEVGAFCRGPRRSPPAPPSSTARAVDEVRRAIRSVGGVEPARALGLIVTFAIPPSAPRVPCRRCDVLVAWIGLPTGGRMAVTAETREAHDATCTGRRMAP